MGKRIENPGRTVLFAYGDYLRMKHPRACAVAVVYEALSSVQLMELPILVETDDYVLLPISNENLWFSKKAAWIKEILVR